MSKTLWVLNPNSTAAMTERVVAQVHGLLGGEAAVRGITATQGPAVIANRASFEAGAQAGLQTLRQALAEASEPPQGVLLACFGDPGLETMRAAWPGLPIHGLAQAAMAEAGAHGRRYAVLTSGPDWVALLNERAAQFGLAAGLTGVHALPVDGKALAAEPERWRAALQAAADAALAQGAQALVLGGAAFAGLQGLVDSPLPVIDGVSAATAAWRRSRA